MLMRQCVYRNANLPVRQLAMGEVDAQLMARDSQGPLGKPANQALGCAGVLIPNKGVTLGAHHPHIYHLPILGKNVVEVFVLVVRRQIANKKRRLIAAGGAIQAGDRLRSPRSTAK